jgi:hypothetical protein
MTRMARQSLGVFLSFGKKLLYEVRDVALRVPRAPKAVVDPLDET